MSRAIIDRHLLFDIQPKVIIIHSHYPPMLVMNTTSYLTTHVQWTYHSTGKKKKILFNDLPNGLKSTNMITRVWEMFLEFLWKSPSFVSRQVPFGYKLITAYGSCGKSDLEVLFVTNNTCALCGLHMRSNCRISWKMNRVLQVFTTTIILSS